MHRQLVEISVADTGIGIAPEDQAAVFEEFRQVGTASKKIEGTGLGLALSRKFVELHGGTISVNSELGVGSTFTLPAEPSLTVGRDSTYFINMKAVQVMLDERLLKRLDATEEVRKDGRSAVLRRALEAYLRQRGRASIAAQYRKAYRGNEGLGREFAGWEEQGVWPDE